jgi:glycosyltransferase involved in cell wall biosynthesis
MNKQKFVLINSLPLDIISGGNIYNQNLCNAFAEKNVEIEYIFGKNIEEIILNQNENTIILLDSYCINEKVNWNNLLNKKIITLLHLAPSADDKKNDEKLQEIIKAEKIVFKNFPILSVGIKAIEYVEEKYEFKVDNYVIIPPAISASWINKIQYNFLPKKLLVLGTITERKGYKRLIETLTLLSEIDWICNCYGTVSDEKLMNDIFNLIKLNNLEKKINFLGTVDNNSMNSIQNDYDLLLQLSDEENNSVVLMEAIASGLPFASTPTGNFNYYIENNCGYIFSSFESKIIANELMVILNDKNEYKKLIHSLNNITPETWENNIENILNFSKTL